MAIIHLAVCIINEWNIRQYINYIISCIQFISIYSYIVTFYRVYDDGASKSASVPAIEK